MKVVDVKKAIATLHHEVKMTQTEIAGELKCTQANVHYHLNNSAKNPSASAVLVERIKVVFASRNLALPMCDAPAGVI